MIEMNNIEKRIRILLDRYYEGLATLDEERELASFANSAAHHNALSADVLQECMFVADVRNLGKSHGENAAEADAAFLMRMSRQIDQWERLETSAQRRAMRRSLQWFSGIAATFALALLLPFAFTQYEDRQDFVEVSAKVCNGSSQRMLTPEEAAAETQHALEMFSETMNKGLSLLSN